MKSQTIEFRAKKKLDFLEVFLQDAKLDFLLVFGFAKRPANFDGNENQSLTFDFVGKFEGIFI